LMGPPPAISEAPIIVMCCGSDGSADLGDAWEFTYVATGSGSMQVWDSIPSLPPARETGVPARSGAAMATLPNGVLLFGGQHSGAKLAQTLVFDGGAWAEVE